MFPGGPLYSWGDTTINQCAFMLRSKSWRYPLIWQGLYFVFITLPVWRVLGPPYTTMANRSGHEVILSALVPPFQGASPRIRDQVTAVGITLYQFLSVH